MKEPKFYRFARLIVTAFVKLVYRPTVVGKENIPKKGGIVLAGNHTNYFDSILLISCTKRTIHFLGKKELFEGKFRWIFKNMAIIPVNRKQKDPNALKSAIDTLNDNKVIGIFPEGTINRTEDVTMPFKFGAVKMCKETNSTMIPFVITGKYRPFRKGLRIEFFKPYKLKGDLEKENNKLRKIVEKGILIQEEK